MTWSQLSAAERAALPEGTRLVLLGCRDYVRQRLHDGTGWVLAWAPIGSRVPREDIGGEREVLLPEPGEP